MLHRKTFLLIFCFIIMGMNVFCGEDYYKILGVPRNADEKTIKKAFKKLSLKYHPDKNKDNPDKAKEMFIKVANAYETLSDPEKKRIYDQLGEEGLKYQQSGGGDGGFDGYESYRRGGGGYNFGFGGGGRNRYSDSMNFEDMFKNFFSGQRYNNFFDEDDDDSDFHYVNRRRGSGRERGSKKSVFADSKIYILNSSNIHNLNIRKHSWIILFFEGENREVKRYAKTWIKVAEKVSDFCTVAIFDCKPSPDLCQRMKIDEVPEIVLYHSANNKGLTYKGDFERIDDIIKFISSKMENYVKPITKKSWDDFLHESIGIPKVVVFTQKDTTSPFFKFLSKEFKDSLVMGEVRANERDLLKKFKVTSFPSIIVVHDILGEKYEKYEGVLSNPEILAYLKGQAQEVKGRSKGVKNLNQLDKNKYHSGSCGPRDNTYCLLFLLDSSSQYERISQMIKPTLQKFKTEPINFYYINSGEVNVPSTFTPVSYTHLTLPTIYSV
eukprot:TRINITY_DN5774_c0_g1_i3.p1 TRINITY_DN5774_c0_g1~~TRINITY_DN5774_c0_g1_i3.p1  ORF type:complete len:494 (+),score=89.53 TRINITY_DN5774_c0_g1_i3:41-1522(+)